MTRWTEVILSHMYPWPIGVLVGACAVALLFGVIGLWSLWRVRRLLAELPAVRERIDSLSNSIALLADTTESCFKVMSMQMQFMQANGRAATLRHPANAADAANAAPRAGEKKARQRRVVGAARRGEALAAIAARENVAESEIALRLHVDKKQPAAPATRSYGSLFS